MLNKVKSLFKKQKKIVSSTWDAETYNKMRLVYTDAFGNNYYMLKDITQLALARAINAENAVRMAEMCLTKKRLQIIVDKITEAANKGDIPEMMAYVYEIKTRLTYAAEEESLLFLSTVYIFIENEPIDQYAEYWQEKKIDLWRQHPETKNFFLQTAWSNTTQYNRLLELDILQYLKEVDELKGELPLFSLRNTSKFQ